MGMQGSINNRINVLYFVDSLCEACLTLKMSNASNPGLAYVNYLARDLLAIVAAVVPEGREGLPNLVSTKQVRPLHINTSKSLSWFLNS
jgi:CTD kinase subunit gamma